MTWYLWLGQCLVQEGLFTIFFNLRPLRPTGMVWHAIKPGLTTPFDQFCPTPAKSRDNTAIGLIFHFVSVFGLVFICSFSSYCVLWLHLFPSTLISATISNPFYKILCPHHLYILKTTSSNM